MTTSIRYTLQKMAEYLSKKKLIRYASIKVIRKLSYDIKKLLTQQVNEGVKHNLNSKVKVITKRIDELSFGKGNPEQMKFCHKNLLY